MVKIRVVIVIRYRGTSPKLGSCQGECPYPCDYVSSVGEEGGGDVGLVDGLGLSLKFALEDGILIPQIINLPLQG